MQRSPRPLRGHSEIIGSLPKNINEIDEKLPETMHSPSPPGRGAQRAGEGSASCSYFGLGNALTLALSRRERGFGQMWQKIMPGQDVFGTLCAFYLSNCPSGQFQSS